MKPHVLLRIAAVVALLLAAGHTAGAPWTPSKGMAEAGLLQLMKSLHFDVMGTSRTYFDFYFGFGVSISVYLFTQAIILWQVAGLAKSNAKIVRPIVATMFLSYIAGGVVTVMYFFAAPIVFSAVVCFFIAWAWAKSE